MAAFIEEHQIPCPSCGKHDFTGIRQFNLMFKTFQGVTEDAKNTVYLRPETAQGIFVNFNNIQRTTRRKLPFGVCQIGKSFRNEITPGNFTFRTREFEQMELEFFCKPGTDLEWFQYWRTYCHDWLLGLNIKDENLRLRDHDPEELCFYSKATTDFEFLFPFGWGELWGVADRTDYDLSQHQKTSGVDMTYFDQEQNEHYIPYVVEPSLGADRVTLAFLVEAYDEEVVGQDKNGKDDIRVVLHFHPTLAPFKAAVLPLSQEAGPQGHGDLSYAPKGLYGGLRRGRLHRQALPPRGRDRHPLLHHRGLPDRRRRKHPRRQRRHHPRPRHHGAGPRAHRPAQSLAHRQAGVLM